MRDNKYRSVKIISLTFFGYSDSLESLFTNAHELSRPLGCTLKFANLLFAQKTT